MRRNFTRYMKPEDRMGLWCGIIIFFKFLLFDLLWSIPTTFASWSTVEFFASKVIAVLFLLIPGKLLRQWWLEVAVMFCLDGLLIANLMYFRTYFTAIPLDSYALGGNLADFMGSVFDSFRWVDILFPLSTVAFILVWKFVIKRKRAVSTNSVGGVVSGSGSNGMRSFVGYEIAWAIALVLFVGSTMYRGGFYKAYDSIRQHAYMSSSTTTMYTIAGNLWFDYINRQQEATPEVVAKIEGWLGKRAEYVPMAESGVFESDSVFVNNADVQRTNCIVILAESFESWVLEREVEGQELTPYLNALLKDSTTLYAPNVLTQVKGGRSIDAQLLLCAGLLPVNSGTYSSQYPGNEYFTLQKALEQKNVARSYLMTIDKVSTWNQGVIAYSFGTDTIVAYHDFKLEEAFGTHKRTGDDAFLRQCAEKISAGEVWPQGENVYMQCITYSGHAPFRLPEELKEVHFSEAIPQKMNDYMTTARYTDRAIGHFVEYLKSLPQYKNTLVVITGDHEGLAAYRKELCETPGGKGIVSEGMFTPFIVLNSPVGMRYNKVMGQIDMYPTLLNLLQLDDYPWKGLGQSILDSTKKGFAVSPQLEIVGEQVSEEDAAYARDAYDISDMVIRFDYLKNLK